ncbi:MAG: DMT family transporter [Clostridia bacterium]|nr:DMT family transporter [Clostridia bacterium]
MKKRKMALLAAMTGNAIFGFSFMFSRIALGVATPYVMLMYRFLMAFAAINIVVLCTRRRAGSGEAMHWLRFDLRGKRRLPLLALGFFQPVCYFLCESYGISLTNSVCSGVIIALEPIAALGFGAVFLAEMPRRDQAAFSVLSISGVIVMTMQQSAKGDIHPLGVVLLVGAVLSAVAYNIISRGISGGYSAMERTYVMMLVAAIVFTLLAVWECRADMGLLLAPLLSAGFMGAMLYLSLLSSIAAFMLLNYASGELPVAMSTAFCNLTTVISVFAGVVFLGEPVSAASIAASVVIVVGIWGVNRRV